VLSHVASQRNESKRMFDENSLETLYFAEINSTNEEAKRRLNAGTLTRPLIIRADSQTAGCGTRGRPWISPPGAGLYFSLVHPFPETLRLWSVGGMDDNPVEGFAQNELFEGDLFEGMGSGAELPITPLFTLAAGVACAEVLRELAQVLVELKPINDLYVNGCKLGGILTESLIGAINQPGPARCRGLITGIGINILDHALVEEGCRNEHRPTPAEMPPETFPGTKTGLNRPTSLQACVPPLLFSQWHGDAIKQELSQALARRIDAYYQTLFAGQNREILERYLLFKIADAELPPSLRQLLGSSTLF
jgi:hypothetical protein